MTSLISRLSIEEARAVDEGIVMNYRTPFYLKKKEIEADRNEQGIIKKSHKNKTVEVNLITSKCASLESAVNNYFSQSLRSD